jgi:hypothetical protein
MEMTIFLRDRYVDPDICQDGETVRRPLLLMDGRPGFARPSDEQITARRAARDEMISRTTEAWRDARKKPTPPDPDDDDDFDVTDPRDARRASRASYDAMCLRLQDAWRHPVDAAQPDAFGSDPDVMRRHLRTDPDDDAQARRDAAYQNYTSSLSEAWKNPPHAAVPSPSVLGIGPMNKVLEGATGRTDPAAAARIERVRERTHGGR